MDRLDLIEPILSHLYLLSMDITEDLRGKDTYFTSEFFLDLEAVFLSQQLKLSMINDIRIKKIHQL